MIHTILHIFEYNLPSSSSSSSSSSNKYPIVCFSQKQNLFYINKTESVSETNWCPLNLEDMTRILKKIQNHLINELMKWKDHHIASQEKQIDTEKVHDIFNKTIIKLMDISFQQDASLSKLKTLLYNYLKVDLKNLIEYEFEF